MANKYHISPGSGRANICRATKKGCPLGADTPHFESKEEANAYIEKSAKDEHSTIPATMKKGRGRPRKNSGEDNVESSTSTVDNVVEDDFDDNEDEYIDRTAAEAERYALKNSSRGNEYSERESRIMKKFVSTDKAFDKGVFVESLNYSLEAESEENNYDVYGGDDDVYDSFSDYDDYTPGDGDNEVSYTGMVIVDRDAMINQYYNELKNNFGDNAMTPNDESQAKGIIKKVLKKYNLFEDYNYAPVIEYGEVDGYTVLGDVDGAMNDFKKIFNS